MQRKNSLPGLSDDYETEDILILTDKTNNWTFNSTKNEFHKISRLENEINKRKDIEKSLKSTINKLQISEKFNRNIIQSSADCIKVLDLDARILMVNNPGLKALEIKKAKEIVGTNWLSYWKGKNFKDAYKAFQKAKQGKIGRFQGFKATLKGTPKWWGVVLSPITNRRGKVFNVISVSRDVTDQKDFDLRKDYFISAASHELKTPITSQMGYIQLLIRSLEKSKNTKSRMLAGKIDKQTKKLEQIITNVLDAAVIEDSRDNYSFHKLNVERLVNDAIKDVQKLSKSHKIYIKGSTDKDIVADRSRLIQVINNLIHNAIKFSPHSNKVIINISDASKKIIVSVKDFGIGIDKKDKEKVFFRFYRAFGKNGKTYPGLGLGLYISREIIKRHGGDIWVESSINKGSTFSFTLPISN